MLSGMPSWMLDGMLGEEGDGLSERLDNALRTPECKFESRIVLASEQLQCRCALSACGSSLYMSVDACKSPVSLLDRSEKSAGLAAIREALAKSRRENYQKVCHTSSLID